MNGTGGKVFVSGQQIEGAGPNVLRGNFVGDINDVRGGVDREYRSLHRAGEIILRAEICQESDD
jgi:hypothetical protein